MGTRQREKEREGMKGERERVVAHARPALCTITAGEQTVDALVVRLSGGAVPAPCRSPRAHPPTACVFWSQLRTARLATSAKRGVLLASAVRAACARSSVLFCVQPCFACPMHVHTYFTQCISRNCIGAALCTITAGEQTVDAFVVLLSGGAVPAPCRSPRVHPLTACVSQLRALRAARPATAAKRASRVPPATTCPRGRAVRAACSDSPVHPGVARVPAPPFSFAFHRISLVLCAHLLHSASL